jgi:hypothetical protein
MDGKFVATETCTPERGRPAQNHIALTKTRDNRNTGCNALIISTQILQINKKGHQNYIYGKPFKKL